MLAAAPATAAAAAATAVMAAAVAILLRGGSAAVSGHPLQRLRQLACDAAATRVLRPAIQTSYVKLAKVCDICRI